MGNSLHKFHLKEILYINAVFKTIKIILKSKKPYSLKEAKKTTICHSTLNGLLKQREDPEIVVYQRLC